MRILVTGASGFVGGHLHRALLAQGHQVVGYVRERQPARDGVDWVVGGMDDAPALRDALAGCDAAIHLIGIIREEHGDTFHAAHVETTRQLINAMREAGVTRLLHMSALGVNPVQRLPYFHSKWEAEELVRESGLDFTIFRPSIIYGPGDGFLATIAYQLQHYPVMPIIGRGEYRLAPLHISTLCAAFTQALTRPETIGETLQLCGPDEVSYRELVALLAREMRVRKLRVPVPVAVMGKIISLAERLRLPFPITHEQMAMLVQGSTCEVRLTSVLPGLNPLPLRDGIAAYARAYTESTLAARRKRREESLT